MPRSLRIEYPGACYHGICRGNARLPVFHLNPAHIKAREDKSPDDRHDIALRYPWSSYGQIMGIRRCPSRLDRRAVLTGLDSARSKMRIRLRKDKQLRSRIAEIQAVLDNKSKSEV